MPVLAAYACSDIPVDYSNDLHGYSCHRGRLARPGTPARQPQTLVSSAAEAAWSHALQSFGPADPFQLVKEEIDSVSERLRRSIFTGIPTLRSAAQYFFKVIFVAPGSVSA